MSEKKVVKTTLAVTIVILLSKLCGFARDVISAGYFGTSMARDAYASAYTLFYIPVLLFSSCITSTVVPIYVSIRDKRSLGAADRYASNCINVFALTAMGIGIGMMALAQPLVKVVFGGFSPEKQLLTAQLTRVMLPSLPFVVISIVLCAVLNANEHFMAAQLTGFPLTVAVIVATVFFSQQHGIGAVAWGVFAAGVLQMLILLPTAKRTMHYQLRIQPDDQMKQMLMLAGPAILSMAVNEFNHVIDKSICSYMNSGDPAAMDYAYRLVTFATGVLATPLTTIMFSRISVKAAEGNRSGIRDVLSRSVQVLTMILLPITVLACVLSPDVIRLAYMHGSFGEESLRVTSAVFLYYMLGLVGFGLRDVLNRAFHAMQDTRTPMLVACFCVILNIALNLTLSRFMGVNGLALATTISCGAGALVLAFLVRRQLGGGKGSGTLRELCKVVAAGIVCLAAGMALNRILPPAQGKGWTFLRLTVATGGSLILYLGALVALRVKQLRFVIGLLRGKQP